MALANGEATGPKSSGLELALVARSPPARTQYAPDSRAGEIAPIRSVDPRTTCAHVRLHRLCFLGLDHVLSRSLSLSTSPLSLSRSNTRFSRRPFPRFPAGTRIGTRIGTRCVVEIGSIVERGRRVTKVRRLLGSSYGRTVIIINDPRVVLI